VVDAAGHKLWKHAVVLVGQALAEGPISTRSHLYHPGFRHEYRAADAQAHADLKAHGCFHSLWLRIVSDR
jgi:precorrin-4/cobalt-precorrin-4 C11-methyltransferase